MSSPEILNQIAKGMTTLLSEPVGDRGVKITDLTPRDGQQCKLATRVSTDDLLPLCAALDDCGFYAVEVWGGATFDVCMRYLKEDPWERLRRLREALPKTRLQMLLRGQNLLGYRHYSDDVVEHFVQRAADVAEARKLTRGRAAVMARVTASSNGISATTGTSTRAQRSRIEAAFAASRSALPERQYAYAMVSW